MSGHSHWASIKYKKGLEDAKRGQAFSKVTRLISLAAREKGSDPKTNYKLRIAIDQAREFNMPQDNIERAIKKGTGEIEGVIIENILLEGFGPGGIGILIEAITDNKNRTVADARNILENYGGKLASGGVLWMFEQKGVIEIDTKDQISNLKNEDLELLIIEAGAEDIEHKPDTLEVYTKPEELEKVKKDLEEKGIKIKSAALGWNSKEEINIEDKTVKEKIEKLFEALDEHDDVQEIYSNLAA